MSFIKKTIFGTFRDPWGGGMGGVDRFRNYSWKISIVFFSVPLTYMMIDLSLQILQTYWRCLFKVFLKVLGKVVEAAKAEEKKVSMVRQNKGKILKVTFLNMPALLMTKVTQDQENTPPCGPESAWLSLITADTIP